MGCIELTADYDFIIKTLNDAEMVSRINEYGEELEFNAEIVEQMDAAGYLLGWYVDDEIKGFYWVHPYMQSMLQIHAHFPLSSRQHSKGSGIEMLNWLRANAKSQYQKFVAYIPVCYPDVIGFSKREGLSHEGFITKAFNKGGNMIDLCVLGASREIS